MPDWRKIVREKLGPLRLRNGRRDEVIEELAQQLECAYEEALAEGVNEQEAVRRSLAQFEDWEKLRSQVFHFGRRHAASGVGAKWLLRPSSNAGVDSACADAASPCHSLFPSGARSSSCYRE